MQNIVLRFENIRCRIQEACKRAKRASHEVQLIAVSKNHTAEAVCFLAQHWLLKDKAIFGESYVQEALEKIPTVAETLTNRQAFTEQALNTKLAWHFIGGIQSRKAKNLIGKFALIHSLDSFKVASILHKTWQDEVASKARKLDEPAPQPQQVLLQINIGEEKQKSGVLPKDLPLLCEQVQALSGLEVQGLMCLPPFFEKAEDSRPFFRQLRELRENLRKKTGLALPHLSMGMSMDFEVAIEEGATLVRVGTDIFGERTPKTKAIKNTTL